jgi:hypothetical protein
MRTAAGSRTGRFRSESDGGEGGGADALASPTTRHMGLTMLGGVSNFEGIFRGGRLGPAAALPGVRAPPRGVRASWAALRAGDAGGLPRAAREALLQLAALDLLRAQALLARLGAVVGGAAAAPAPHAPGGGAPAELAPALPPSCLLPHLLDLLEPEPRVPPVDGPARKHRKGTGIAGAPAPSENFFAAAGVGGGLTTTRVLGAAIATARIDTTRGPDAFAGRTIQETAAAIAGVAGASAGIPSSAAPPVAVGAPGATTTLTLRGAATAGAPGGPPALLGGQALTLRGGGGAGAGTLAFPVGQAAPPPLEGGWAARDGALEAALAEPQLRCTTLPAPLDISAAS